MVKGPRRRDTHTPIMLMVPVKCSICCYNYHAPKGCIWPVACPRCSSDAAPIKVLREWGIYKAGRTRPITGFTDL